MAVATFARRHDRIHGAQRQSSRRDCLTAMSAAAIIPTTIREQPALGHVLGTPLVLADYAGVTKLCNALARVDRCVAVDFTNTHIVTMRRHEPEFRALT